MRKLLSSLAFAIPLVKHNKLPFFFNYFSRLCALPLGVQIMRGNIIQAHATGRGNGPNHTVAINTSLDVCRSAGACVLLYALTPSHCSINWAQVNKCSFIALKFNV